MSDNAYPHEANLVLFTRAYESHLAAATMLRGSNVLKPAHMTDEVYAQRAAVLALGGKIALAERNQLLDEFCRQWLKYRSLPLDGEQAKAGG
jgi:hypothetical protein